MSGETIRFFPAFLQEKTTIDAFAKVLDYLFFDSTYSSGGVSLPLPGNTHNAFFDDTDNKMMEKPCGAR